MLAGQTASGDIRPSRFVKKSGAYTVAESDANEVCIGISHEGTKAAPLPGASTLAAAAGDPLRVYSDGETCLLEAGAAVTAGARLKSDADGRGVTAAAGEPSYAVAERGAAAAGEKMQVVIRPQFVPA